MENNHLVQICLEILTSLQTPVLDMLVYTDGKNGNVPLFFRCFYKRCFCLGSVFNLL